MSHAKRPKDDRSILVATHSDSRPAALAAALREIELVEAELRRLIKKSG